MITKVHKKESPLRPILSMPGSQFEKLSKELAEIIKKLPEAGIRTDRRKVLETIQTTKLEEDEMVVSLDIEGLFTNVPLDDAIELTVNLLYEDDDRAPNFSRSTFRTLLQMVAKDVVLLTHRGTFQQVDGVAMGSPVGPLLANIFVSRFDAELGSFSKFYFRYVDDVIWTVRVGGRQYLLDFVNSAHPNLKFTIEEPHETNGLAFLDMKVHRLADGTLSSEWYRKNTDTGILLNFHALGPKIYKRALVSGFVHRIFSTISSWLSFNKSLKEAQGVLRNNQYPRSFVENVTNYTLSKLLGNANVNSNNQERQKTGVYS